MCMDVVTEAFANPTYQMVARWKVFRVGYDTRFLKGNEAPSITVLTALFACNCSKDWIGVHECCPRDEWLLSDEAVIGQESNMIYASGFHVLATERDAEEYCGAVTSFGGRAIKIEVMVMGLKAIGRANISRADNAEHPAHVDCEVYDWMNIPPVGAKLDVSAQEVENAIRYLFSEVGEKVLEAEKESTS